MRRTSTLIGLGTAVAAILTAVTWPSPQSEREAYNEFIQNHPYSQPDKSDHKGPPGLDRPGEAAKFEFIRTVDPRTRTIPTQRLYRANEIGVQQIRDALTSPRGATSALVTTDWEERGPDNIGGRTRAVMFDPNDMSGNKVWAGGVSGGLWSTSDITTDGTIWVKQNDFWENLAVTTMAYDPVVTTTFYVGTGEGFFNIDAVQGGGIFKSTDGGVTFNRLASTDPSTDSTFEYVQKVVVTASGTVLAATREGGGIQRSTDGGASWTQVLRSGISGATTSRASDLEIDAAGNIYASLGIFSFGGVWKSTDDGQTWTQQSMPFAASGNANSANNYGRIEICTAPSDASTVYVATHSAAANNVNHVFRTTDGGTNWTSRTTPTTGAQAWYDLICQVDPNDEDTVYLGVQVRLQRSTNGGSTWSTITGSLHPDFHAIVFRPGSSTDAVIGHDGGVDYTSNFNAGSPSYTDRNDGYNVTQYYGGDLSPTSASNFAIAGAQDNSTQLFDSAGIDTATSPSPLSCCDGGFAIIDQDDANFMVGSIQFGNMSRSTNGGASFGSFFTGSNAGLFIPQIIFDNANDVLYSSNATDDRILRVTSPKAGSPTVDTSVVVSVSNNSNDLEGETSAFAVSPFTVGSSTVFLGSESGQIVKVTGAESGATVSGTDISGTINAGYVSSIELGMDEDHILVTLSNYGVNSVYESLDGGSNWSSKQGDLPDMPVRWAMYNPNNFDQVILATESGIWETLDIGVASPTWTRVPGFPTVRVDQLQTRSSDDAVYAFTHGRGVWSATWRGITTSTTTAVVTDGTPTTFGDTITFTATVTGTSNPTGTVTFRADTVDITGCVDVSLTGGGNTPTAECMVSTLDAGTYDIVAAYGGDVSNGPSASSGISQVVNQASQTITFNNPGTQTFSPGGTFALAATGGGSGHPIVFASTTTGVCTVSGSTATIVSAGNCNITANQAGNTNYSAAPQVARDITINQASQTISFTDPGTQTYSPGGTFALNATGGGSGNPIVFASTTTGVCTVSGSTATIVSVGNCNITANQAGNTNYSAAPQVARDITIDQASQTISFTDPGAQTYSPGGTFALNATGGASGNPIVFASTTTGVCTVSGSTATIVSAGNCNITANQAGNTNYSAAPQVARDITINQASQTISFTDPGTQTYSPGGMFALNATGGASGNPIVFASTTTGVCTVSGSTATIVSAGNCNISANQAGNTNYSAAPQVARDITINQATQTISFTDPGPQTYSPGGTFALNATGGASGNPIVFASTTTGVCTVSGSTATIVSAGNCNITANQAGNTNYSAAPQVARDITINQASQTITFDDPGTQTFAPSGTFGLSATGGGSGNPIVFASTTTGVCTVSGSTATIVSAGTCSLTANQAGNTNYSAAPEVTRDVTIDPADQTITFDAIPDQTLTIIGVTASASASSGLPVTLVSNTPSICTTAGLFVMFEDMRGVCEITATQPGNGNFNAAPTVDQSFIIREPTSVSFFTSPSPSNPGEPYTVFVVVAAPFGIPTGGVTITDDNLQTCEIPVLNSAVGQCDITPVTTGLQTLTATFTGTDFFADSVHVDVHAVGSTTDLTAIATAATPVLEMGEVTVSVVVSNNGPLDALGSELTISGMTNLDGLSWTCSVMEFAGVPIGTCPADNGTGVIDTTVDLPLEGGLEFLFTGTVTTAPGSTVDVTAEIQPPAGTTEAIPADNIADESFVVGEQAIFNDGFETP